MPANASPVSMAGIAALLERVENTPPRGAGVFAFALAGARRGYLFVENRRVCWAIAGNDGRRLTDLLLDASGTRLERSVVEAMYVECRRTGAKLGESLVRSGLIDADGLSNALLQHTCENVVALAASGADTPLWVAHRRGGFSPRYTFCAGEILAAIGASRHPAGASRAKHALSRVLRGGGTGAAFARVESATPEPVATRRAHRLPPRRLLEIGRRAVEVLDLSGFLDPARELAAASLDDGRLVVVWGSGDLVFAVLCEDPALLALTAAGIRGTLRVMRTHAD